MSQARQRFLGRLRHAAILVALGLAASGVAYAAAGGELARTAKRQPAPGRLAPYTLPMTATADPEAEIAFYQARLKRDPDGFLNLAALAEAYLRRASSSGEPGYFLLAEQAARRSLADMPTDNPGAFMVLARVAIARHGFEEGLALAKRAEEEKPGLPAALAARVTANLALGRVEEAAKAAEALVARLPSLGTLTQRALVRQAQGREAEAIADLEAAIAREQAGELAGSALARTYLGRLHLLAGRLEPAADLLNEALRIDPAQPLALGLMARVEARRGHYEEAIRHLERAHAARRDPADLLMLSQIQARMGRAQAARESRQSAERALRRSLTAGEFGHRRDLARLLLERGAPQDVAEAVALMNEEVKLRQDPETLTVQAWALHRAGRQHDAASIIRRALAGPATGAGAYALASRIDQALGRSEPAKQLAARALALDPGYRLDPAYQPLLGDS